jgi:hypothetical protein
MKQIYGDADGCEETNRRLARWKLYFEAWKCIKDNLDKDGNWKWNVVEGITITSTWNLIQKRGDVVA